MTSISNSSTQSASTGTPSIYNDNKITTQTVILASNLNISGDELYECIKVLDIDVGPGKKNSVQARLLKDPRIQTGDILFKKCKHLSEGYSFEKKKQNPAYFRNSMTIIVKVDDKFLNAKIANKGKIQITGCSKDKYIPLFISILWKLFLQHPSTFTYREDPGLFKVLVLRVMVNINFSLGFQVNQTEMHRSVLKHTDCVSIYEKTSGYVGVNIKIVTTDENIDDIQVEQYVLQQDCATTVEMVRYVNYLDTLSAKERKKRIPKCYTNTFLVFYSGKVIMSGGVSSINRTASYNRFMDIVNKYRPEFETVYE